MGVSTVHPLDSVQPGWSPEGILVPTFSAICRSSFSQVCTIVADAICRGELINPRVAAKWLESSGAQILVLVHSRDNLENSAFKSRKKGRQPPKIYVYWCSPTPRMGGCRGTGDKVDECEVNQIPYPTKFLISV